MENTEKYRIIRGGEIRRTADGYYIFVSDVRIAVHVWQPKARPTRLSAETPAVESATRLSSQKLKISMIMLSLRLRYY